MLYLLTGLGLVLFVVAVATLIGLVRSGQLDDLDTPPARMLADDVPACMPGTEPVAAVPARSTSSNHPSSPAILHPPTTGRPDDRTTGRVPV